MKIPQIRIPKPETPKYANYYYVAVWDCNDNHIGWIRVYRGEIFENPNYKKGVKSI